jgi:hypothetical protein
MPVYLYAIGAGWNVALVSLTNVELIRPTGERYLYPPQSFGTYDPGIFRVRGDGSVTTSGKPFLLWRWTGQPGGRLTYGQARHIQTTYAAGGWSGKVTIYTKTTNSAAYERYNAMIILPKFSEAEPNFRVFTRFDIRMTQLAAL